MAMVNPGKANLISWWSLGEASGDALDSHGSNTLAETSGTIASAAGKVGNGRDFEYGDTEYFEIADNAGLSFADEAFTIGAWVKIESAATAVMAILSKYNNTDNKREYMLAVQTDGNPDVFRFSVSYNGTNYTDVFSTASASTGTWYLVIAWHDPSTNKIYIQVNNGTPDEAAHTTGCNDNTSPFRIGAYGGTAAGFFDGIIDEAFVFDDILTADEREWLYNGGSGRSYAELVGGAEILRSTILEGFIVR